MAHVSHPGAARWLNVHAIVVGAGWFFIAFAGLVGLQSSALAQEWVATWPAAAQGIGATVVLAAAIPLLWPVYIGIGWYEAVLATRISTGDRTAQRAAVRLLRVQALMFAVAGVMAVGVAWLFRDVHGAAYALLAWLPLALIAALHLQTARTVTR